MLQYKKLKIGKRNIEALRMKLGKKNLIVLKGKRGYVMCGYLNIGAAEQFEDVAVKITGVSSFSEALRSSVHSCTAAATRLGIHIGQPLREVLEIIA
ncbi:MAG: DUF1805 domain-containing protein [Candidatus Omnitrophota bacterium]|jgi:uncharacterized protein YunC (DUF1805 family)|nr:MAG: DUF1805 domain-containing protein [Candidatus Omnitrophota bacterium]